jgi:hypothetical protein
MRPGRLAVIGDEGINRKGPALARFGPNSVGFNCDMHAAETQQQFSFLSRVQALLRRKILFYTEFSEAHFCQGYRIRI